MNVGSTWIVAPASVRPIFRESVKLPATSRVAEPIESEPLDAEAGGVGHRERAGVDGCAAAVGAAAGQDEVAAARLDKAVTVAAAADWPIRRRWPPSDRG